MLETAAPGKMQAHYDRAHCLRAQAFAGAWRSLVALWRAKRAGPRLVARPQAC